VWFLENMRIIGAITVALTATVVAADSWSLGDVLSSLGLSGLWHEGSTPSLPPPTAGEENGSNWAVLVAGSNGWFNYRHQVDVRRSTLSF
jgi:hypothetical protein